MASGNIEKEMEILTKEVIGMDCDMVVGNFPDLGEKLLRVSFSKAFFIVPGD